MRPGRIDRYSSDGGIRRARESTRALVKSGALLGSACLALSLGACDDVRAKADDVTVNSGEASPAVRMGQAPDKPGVSANAAADPRIGTALDPLQFDLICDTASWLESDSDPTRIRRSLPAHPSKWDGRFRYIVDLEAMQFCTYTMCRMGEPEPIASANAERIQFVGEPSRTETLRLRDGAYRVRSSGDGRVYVTRGSCIRKAFSKFPVPKREYWQEQENSDRDLSKSRKRWIIARE